MMLTEKFAQFIYNLRYEELPQEVITLAKERILDSIGAVLAGAKNWTYREEFLKACHEMEQGDYPAFTTGDLKFPVCRAAMINATFGHAVELDDGHAYAGAHAGTVAIPVAFAIAAQKPVGGRQIIESVVGGYDVVYRIAVAMAPHQIDKGFHPTSNDDTLGAAVVAGKLLGLSEGQLADALGMAGLYASGLMEATITGQLSKCIMVGNAALTGMNAAYYAASGIGGTTSVFEGKSGFFRAKSQDVDLEKIESQLGTRYTIMDTYSKMYPTCRHAQPAIEGALNLLEKHGFMPEDIAEIRVGTHEVAYNLTGKIKEPKDSGEAKFSIAYGIAVAICRHGFGIGDLMPQSTNNSDYLALADKVITEIDPNVQAEYPTRRGARVQIRLKNGKVLSEEVYDLKGSPKNPVGFDDIKSKFITNVRDFMPENDIDMLIGLVMNLEKLENLSPLTNILSKKR